MSKGTVLVVDDDRAIQEFVVNALEMEGYRIYQALNGQTQRVARAVQPDVILRDVLMPQMDGAEVSQRVRAERATVHIPIVAMSTLLRSRVPPALWAEG